MPPEIVEIMIAPTLVFRLFLERLFSLPLSLTLSRSFLMGSHHPNPLRFRRLVALDSVRVRVRVRVRIRDKVSVRVRV